jgi:signal transduction histidine kinase
MADLVGLSVAVPLPMEAFPRNSERKLDGKGTVSVPKPYSLQSRFILMEAATVLLAFFLMAGALILSGLIRSQFSSGVEDLHQQIALHSKIHEAFDRTVLAFWRYYGSNDPTLLQQYRNYSSELRQFVKQNTETSTTVTDQQDAKNLTQLETSILSLTDRLVAGPPGKPASEPVLAGITMRELAVRKALSVTAQAQFERLQSATDRLAVYTRILRAVLLVLGLFPVLVMLWFRHSHQLHIWDPLERLHRMVLEVKRGNLDVQGSAPSNVELGSVTTAFLTMSAELRDMRSSLEEKVHQRAMQLEAAQKDLLRAAKLASLGQLVSGVAHEINNPLTSILGFSEIVLANDKLSDTVRKQVRTMRDEALRLKRLVANLCQFARRTPQQLHRLDLRSVPDRLLELRSYQLAANSIRLEYRRAEKPIWVKGDYDTLLQVMLQLALNAEHAIRDHRESGEICLRCETSGTYGLLSVADNGCGMNDEMREHVFDPFFTTRPSRYVAGLGLSVCHGIVEQHGGEIAVESELNKGTTFRIRLPLANNESKSETHLVASGSPRSHRAT